MEKRTVKTTIAEVKEKNREAGQHFFEKDTMRFFDSRIESKVYQGTYFVTSEQFHGLAGDGERLFTIREFDYETGKVDTAGNTRFQEFTSLEVARERIRELITEWREVK